MFQAPPVAISRWEGESKSDVRRRSSFYLFLLCYTWWTSVFVSLVQDGTVPLKGWLPSRFRTLVGCSPVGPFPPEGTALFSEFPLRCSCTLAILVFPLCVSFQCSSARIPFRHGISLRRSPSRRCGFYCLAVFLSKVGLRCLLLTRCDMGFLEVPLHGRLCRL